MPEGPEVRKYADAIAGVLQDEKLLDVWARTREANAWLQEHPDELPGRRVLRVHSHGKHLLIQLEDKYFFHSHLMMWGRWQVLDEAPDGIDRRERARLVTKKGCAILFSAPVFAIGQGDPYKQSEILASLGPDVLPYDGEFDALEFVRRLEREENAQRTIGAVLLDQSVVAGIGNYLRAEILFECRIDPWRQVVELSSDEIACLSENIPLLSRRSYLTGGTTSEDDRARLLSDATMLYQSGSDWGARHYTFRRTNLPCLRCGEKIRQLRQMTKIIEGEEGDEEKTRIIYFCPQCQGVTQQPKTKQRTR